MTLFEGANLVLWSDDALLVVNKPAGLPTLPDGYHPEAPYLVGLLKSAFAPLWTVHRLDRETSGVMVFARTAQAHRNLNIQFDHHQIVKVYHALVLGNPSWEERTLSTPLRADGDRKHRTIIDPQRGKPATTEVRVLERFGRYTLVEAIPRTGRTHQIRAHLSAQGHPLAVDKLYGNGQAITLTDIKPDRMNRTPGERPLLARLGLHAWSITLTHPVHADQRSFQAAYPADFEETIKQLRQAVLTSY